MSPDLSGDHTCVGRLINHGSSYDFTSLIDKALFIVLYFVYIKYILRKVVFNGGYQG